MRTDAPRYRDDRIAVRWPRPVAHVVQDLHYRVVRHCNVYHWGDAFIAERRLPGTPTSDYVKACRKGTAEEQAAARDMLCLQLLLFGQGRLVRGIAQGRRPNCVANRVLAVSLDKLLDHPRSQNEARVRLTRILALIHPDKVAALEGGRRSLPSDTLLRDGCAYIIALRNIVADPHLGQALFVPGRLVYGHECRWLAATIAWCSAWIGCLAGFLGLARRPRTPLEKGAEPPQPAMQAPRRPLAAALLLEPPRIGQDEQATSAQEALAQV